jgi:FkbM family methyltransferase
MKIGEINPIQDVPVKILKEEGVRYEIVLPDADKDHIQRMIFETGQPYELELLRNMRQRINEGDLVLDVGANVGNHALYLALVAKARVIAFEPNVQLCSTMVDSIARNGAEDIVSVQTLGLGRERSCARFQASIPENLGAQALEIGEGEIEVVTLDSLDFDTAVRAIKIDVEGMELAVIQGGRELINRYRPFLYVECQDDASFRQMLSWAQTHDYTYWETFNATPTHLFLPSETISLEKRIDNLIAHNPIREYRLIDRVEQSRRLEAEARAEVKLLEKELALERSGRKVAESKVEALRDNLVAQADALDQRAEESKRQIEEARVSGLELANQWKRELEDAQNYAREVEDRLLAVLNSNTWKLMEPVRFVMRLVKRRNRQPPFVPQLRDGASPKSISEKSTSQISTPTNSRGSNIDDLAKKLWHGFSEPTLHELEHIVDDSQANHEDRAKAAWNLARWTATGADWDASLSFLGKVAYLDKKLYRAKRPRVLAIEANLRAGNIEKAIEYAEHGLNRELDGNYICGISNALLCKGPPAQVDHERLAMLNKLYEAEELASIALIDPGKGLVFGNLTSEGEISSKVDGPKVSVLVPVFNAAEFLETAIRSLFAQSWRNLEIIAVDDASTDDSWDRLQRLAEEDSRLCIFRNETNLGAYPTRNNALKRATGEIITVHDSDDWSHPQMIEIQAGTLLNSSVIKAAFSMMTRVLPNMDFRLRPERNFLEYVHRSYPSLMMHRDDLTQLEQWDDVAANADDELVQRARARWGNDALHDVLPLTPLSFFLRHDQSLTEQEGTHLRSLTFGIRLEYANQAAYWRKAVAKEYFEAGRSFARTDIKTPFPIPAGLAPKNWKLDPRYDLVIISDLSLLGGTRRCNEGYIAAATALGMRVGLFHWPRYDLSMRYPILRLNVSQFWLISCPSSVLAPTHTTIFPMKSEVSVRIFWERSPFGFLSRRWSGEFWAKLADTGAWTETTGHRRWAERLTPMRCQCGPM